MRFSDKNGIARRPASLAGRIGALKLPPPWVSTQGMIVGSLRPTLLFAVAALLAAALVPARAQMSGPGIAGGMGGSLPGVGAQFAPEGGGVSLGGQPLEDVPGGDGGSAPLSAPGVGETGQFELKLPPIGYAAPEQREQMAIPAGEITLSARLTDASEEIARGLIWRIFADKPQGDGKLPLIASAQGGTSVFRLEPGTYLIHAAFGRAGATKRITVGRDPMQEDMVLDAGGLKLDAVLSGGVRISPNKLKFSIYEAQVDSHGERPLIIPDVRPNAVVRLNAGTYHVVSTYGAVNAVIRADIRVEAGKLTEATVEHRAAQLTMKLVREEGGEAIADTSWSVLNDSGDIVRESVGAFSSMVLAEGNYTAIAKNRDHIYQKAFTVVAGRNQDVEVFAQESSEIGKDADPLD